MNRVTKLNRSEPAWTTSSNRPEPARHTLELSQTSELEPKRLHEPERTSRALNRHAPNRHAQGTRHKNEPNRHEPNRRHPVLKVLCVLLPRAGDRYHALKSLGEKNSHELFTAGAWEHFQPPSSSNNSSNSSKNSSSIGPAAGARAGCCCCVCWCFCCCCCWGAGSIPMHPP